MLTDTRKSPYSKIKAINNNDIHWTYGLWAEAYKSCIEDTVPQLQHMFDSKDISHVIENFKICAKEVEGEHDGTVFGDGDFYKWMEAALYSKDEKQIEALDAYIDLFSRAQQSDGYLSTKQIIGEMTGNGVSRMGDVNDFEIYNFGHLFTTACLHQRITGKDNLMTVAIKAADYLYKLYKKASETGEVQTAVCPSHYMGLVEMYRTTGDERYKELAKLSIELRDSVENGTDDNQDRIPLKTHEKIVGHAVRANYLYAGVADLCAEINDDEYLQMLDKVWDSLMDHKIYITGGCGALYNGVSPYGNFFIDQKVHQAYGYEYQLPNTTAYNETCASVGLVMWAYRMFTLRPEAKYIDMLERTMLNTNLAAVSLDGKKFFYENMLRRNKKLEYDLVWPLTRTEYIISYCCPPNLARAIAQSSEYAYASSENGLYTLMFGGNEAKISLENGSDFTIVQETDYPYDGKIKFTFKDILMDKGMILYLRVPGWLEEGSIQVSNKVLIELQKKDGNSFIKIELKKLEGITIDIDFQMQPRLTQAHNMIEENTNQVALEKGPLVYCIESEDVKVDTLDDILFTPDMTFKPIDFSIQDRKLKALEAEVLVINRSRYDRNALYQSLNFEGLSKSKVRFIPYFAWDNRAFGEMRIWFPLNYPME